MPEHDLVIGVDVSTTSCKAILWDQAGACVAEGRAPLELITPAPDLYEQSADTWWQACCQALGQALAQVDPIRLAGLAIAHQRESFVLLDNRGDILRNAILWMDERSRPYLADIESRLGGTAFHQRTGKPLTGNLVVGKLAWLSEHEPHTLARAGHLLDTHAFLVHRLTGAWATSAGSADPLGLYDMRSQDWDTPTLQLAGISPDLLPSVTQPGSFIGRVTEAAAKETGLLPGLPVFAGLGDGQAAALGAGIISSGLASLSLGTSVISGTFSPIFTTSRAFRTMTGALPGSCILETVLLGGAYTLQWFTNDFMGGLDRAAIEENAATLPPGSAGLILLPYWNTAMNPFWDATASGLVAGWRGHHRPEHFYRAILEGIGLELRMHFEGVEEALGQPVSEIIVSGGGAQSRLWLHILADILGKNIVPASTHETAALGAGILAAAGAKLHTDIAGAAQAMLHRTETAIRPDPARHSFYSQLYLQVYKPLYPAVRSSLTALSGLTNQIIT
jgi:sugar (pentulose or hexulose) kinase